MSVDENTMRNKVREQYGKYIVDNLRIESIERIYNDMEETQ